VVTSTKLTFSLTVSTYASCHVSMLHYNKCCDHVLNMNNCRCARIRHSRSCTCPSLGMFVSSKTPTDVPLVTKCPQNQNNRVKHHRRINLYVVYAPTTAKAASAATIELNHVYPSCTGVFEQDLHTIRKSPTVISCPGTWTFIPHRPVGKHNSRICQR